MAGWTASALSGYMGSTVTFTISGIKTCSRITCKNTKTGATTEVATNLTATNGVIKYVWTVPDVADTIPNATQCQLKITFYCVGADGKNTSEEIPFTAYLPSSVVPTIDSVTVTETVSGLATTYKAFIQSKSKVKVAITASGAKGSTVTDVTSTLEGVNYTGTSWTATDFFAGSGTVNLVTTVTDSRGRTGTKTTPITVLAYSPPQITAFSAWRVASSAANSAAKDDGNYVAVQYAYTVPSLNGGNKATMTVRAKQATAASYGTTLLSGTALTANTTARPATALSSDYRWDIQITVTDNFGASTSAELQIPSAEVIFDFRASGDGWGIGKTSEQVGVDFNWPVTFREKAIAGVFLAAHPVGSYYWSSVNTSPASLFGGTWVQIKDRFVLAAGDDYSAGDTGGEAAHALTMAEMPSHNHSSSATNRVGITTEKEASSGTNYSGYLNTQYHGEGYYTLAAVQGGDEAHNNMPPYIVAYCWRRTA